MSNTIFELAKSYLGDNFSQNAASQLNETPDGISKSLQAILPTIFAGVGHKAQTDPSFMSTVFSLAKNIFTNGSLNNLGNIFSDTQSTAATQAGSFVTNLFGNSFHALLEKISAFAGVNTNAARGLFEASSVATLGSIGRHAVENGATNDNILNYFKDNKSQFISAIPASLGIGSLLTNITNTVSGTPEVTDHVKDESVKVPYNNHEAPQKKGGNKFLVPLLIILAAIALLLFLLRQCNKSNPPVTNDSLTVAPINTDTITNTSSLNSNQEAMIVTLPSGKTIQAYKSGIEDQMVAFLQSPEYTSATEEQLKDKWFTFDNLNFEFNSATLTPDSRVQMENLIAILQEFPEAKIKIGAYTDNVGDAADNLKLSQTRADAVKSELKGVGPQVVGAEGYGSQFATAPATASDEERKADRKTAIRFVK